MVCGARGTLLQHTYMPGKDRDFDATAAVIYLFILLILILIISNTPCQLTAGFGFRASFASAHHLFVFLIYYVVYLVLLLVYNILVYIVYVFVF